MKIPPTAPSAISGATPTFITDPYAGRAKIATTLAASAQSFFAPYRSASQPLIT